MDRGLAEDHENDHLEFAVKNFIFKPDRPEVTFHSKPDTGAVHALPSPRAGRCVDQGLGEGVEAADPAFWDDFTALSMRQLRIMCNQVFRDLDSENPAPGAAARYEEISAEIESRAAAVRDKGPVEAPRAAFRDNVFSSRFEFLHDGILAAYLKYEMHGEKVRLLETVVQPSFRGLNLNVEAALIRGALLQTHRRRLSVVPVCNTVAMFLTEYPQYLQLISSARTFASK